MQHININQRKKHSEILWNITENVCSHTATNRSFKFTFQSRDKTYSKTEIKDVFFNKQHFYKQRQAEIGNKISKI